MRCGGIGAQGEHMNGQARLVHASWNCSHFACCCQLLTPAKASVHRVAATTAAVVMRDRPSLVTGREGAYAGD